MSSLERKIRRFNAKRYTKLALSDPERFSLTVISQYMRPRPKWCPKVVWDAAIYLIFK